jgi:DNA-binding CsgD family transcriptional regulator
MPDAVRNRKVILGSREVIEERYIGFTHVDLQTPWRSLVVIPTAGRLVATLHLLCDMDDPDFAILYFQIVGAILSFYQHEELRPLNQQSGLGKVAEQESPVIARIEVGRPLTERQQMILSMIKELKSNPQIAALMGYSESLIRQETIIIYKKLGVSGRNEILGR